MPVFFNVVWELRSGNKKETATKSRMSENKIWETNPAMSAHESNTENESERQLEVLTQLIQGRSTAHWLNFFLWTGTRTSSSAAGPSLDIEWSKS